jgi:prepilin-type N-terminal cleavage/methylation domain-containing protein
MGDRQSRGFTLIELLVVITIIVILMGLLFPAFRGVQDQAKKTQAKNDLTQIVTAVNAFYTEYGRYPTTATTDATFGSGGTNNDALFNELRGTSTALNTRQIVFMSPPDAKDASNPRSGIAPASSGSSGQYFDPWGKPYIVRIDSDYDNQVDNPYTGNTGAGADKIRQGVIAWSLGKDGLGGSGAKTATPPASSDDDVISWQ